MKALVQQSSGVLLDRMMRAWEGAHSNHFTMRQHMVIIKPSSTTTVVSRDVGDVDWQMPPTFVMRTHDRVVRRTDSGTAAHSDNEIQRYSQNLLAIRLDSPQWSCDRFFGYSALPGSPLWDETSAWGIEMRNLGVTTTNGERVWHLRSRLIPPGPGGSKNQDQRDYYFSVIDYRPVLIHTYFADTTNGVTHRTQTTLSFDNFGEAVRVVLPPACRGK